MTPIAQQIHAHLRGDEGRTAAEIYDDLNMIARVRNEPRPRVKQVAEALDELKALGLVEQADGVWKWLPAVKEKPKQAELF